MNKDKYDEAVFAGFLVGLLVATVVILFIVLFNQVGLK